MVDGGGERRNKRQEDTGKEKKGGEEEKEEQDENGRGWRISHRRPPHARIGEKREWRRENKSAPSSIHGALMCHLTEIPPIRGIDLQSNAPLCASCQCAWVWSCIMHEGGWAGVGVDPRNSCNFVPRNERTSCIKFIILQGGKDRDKYGRGDAGKTGSLIGQVKNDG